MKNNKDKIISNYKQQIEEIISNHEHQSLTENKLVTLLVELQIAESELEVQNDELSMSAKILETERAEFADFFNLVPVGYFILDHLGRVTKANEIGLKLLCVEESVLLNQQFQRFIAPDSLEKFYSFLHKMRPNEAKQTAEIKMQLFNGDQIYTKMEGIAVHNLFSDVLVYCVTVTDITASKLAEQKLQVTTERLEMSLKASGTGTWSIDLIENRVFLDEFSLKLLALHSWEFDGSIKKFLELVHPEDQFYVKRQLLNDTNNEEKIDLEFRVIIKGQTKYIATKGHRIQTELGKQLSIGILLDMTERKKIVLAKQDLHDEKQKLILATTLNAQENERQKISSILHDSICQLLYGIRLHLPSMKLNDDSKAEFQMVNHLLDQAIKETRELSYELTPSVLRDFGFVEGIREMAQRLSFKNFRISIKLSEEANLLSADLQLSVFRIVQELINNSIKHANADKAEINFYTEGNKVTILVYDNGNGFDEDLETLMARGSGLRGIRSRLSLLNGHMEVESSNVGTQIKISFTH
ncbi:sensor histidine kinase [Pedobacter boryungensis]|uniref:PAS domain S-box protein n=1 Tax=Pedobacter boryungensis TaxID=869962 RepID=A0ABX2DFV1_9SPHI|nr:PAS domain S-box protein [Pedobacter boryungensis]NQX32968.1 PAS domain S-box protein [Pedobacter boryungensis]